MEVTKNNTSGEHYHYLLDLYMQRTFYNTACGVCLFTGPDLKYCSRCKIMPYCSKNHQSQDWIFHKSLCNAIKRTAKYEPLTPFSSFREYCIHRLTQNMRWVQALGRKLEVWEKYMWMFPRVCVYCFSKENLFPCPNCYCVSYCSVEHRKIHHRYHSENCAELRLGLEIDRFFLKNLPIPLYKIDHMEDEKDKFPEDYDKYFIPSPEIEVEFTNEHENVVNILKRESTIIGATLIHAFERAQLVENRQSKKESLLIHVVGASLNEGRCNWGLNSELIFHWITNLKNIHFILIGPETEGDIAPVSIKTDMCLKCSEGEKAFVLEYHQKFYHEIIDSLPKPDMVAVFNCGLHEYETDEEMDYWQPSIRCLVQNTEVPLMLTSLTKSEMDSDLNRITSLDVQLQFIVENKKNSFCGRRPCRNWMHDKKAVFYNDERISILKAI